MNQSERCEQVDILSKDYIFFPVCDKLHWSLYVVRQCSAC